MRPVETLSSSAGIWLTSPSPTLSRLYFDSASVSEMWCTSTPMAKPPIRLMMVMMMAAIASPLTKLVAPSIAP